MKNNILVQYRGGGYSGCIWEWNFFFIDKDGTFHDVYSSGCAGITSKENGQNLIDENTNHIYIYDVTDKKEIETFCAECNPVNVTGVLQWFEDNPQDNIEFFATCSVCGYAITSCDELCLENWHGCGGIATTADVLLCNECRSSGTCDCCDEYVGAEDLISTGTYADENGYKNQAVQKMDKDGYCCVCSCCLEYQAEQIETDDHKDLLCSSLSTGVPDLFSDKMRWYWD